MMKKTVFIALISFLVLPASSLFAGLDDLDTMARRFVDDYAAKNPKILFKKNVAVLNFDNLSPAVKDYDTGSAAAAALSVRLSQSTIFTLVERSRVKAILDEVSLSMTGAVDPARAARAGEISGAELLVLGTVSEQGDRVVVNGRLVDASTGEVLSTSEVSIPRGEVLAESKEIYFSAFHSEYGISISVNPGVLVLTGDYDNKAFQFQSVEVSYRLFRYMNIGGGYFFTSASEFVRETVSFDANTDVKRNYSFTGTGPLLFIEGIYPVLRWLNLGLRVDYMFFATDQLEQDLAEIQVGYIDPVTSNPLTHSERVLITSWSDDKLPTIFRFSLKSQFLVSKRLSFQLMTGYVLATDYIPIIYESKGIRHWNDDIDQNGIFEEYSSTYNFSRFDNGRRVKLNLSGFTFSMGVGLHF